MNGFCLQLDSRPLIVTACLDERAQAHFNALRRAHFPAERNYLDAHLTLFHKLRGQDAPLIVDHFATIAAVTLRLSAASLPSRSLGRGVAVPIDCPRLITLRNDLAAKWKTGLTPQDQQPFKPHITIQNKVDPRVAAELLETLKNSPPLSFLITGLQLWHYNGGPWSPIKEFSFL